MDESEAWAGGINEEYEGAIGGEGGEGDARGAGDEGVGAGYGGGMVDGTPALLGLVNEDDVGAVDLVGGDPGV